MTQLALEAAWCGWALASSTVQGSVCLGRNNGVLRADLENENETVRNYREGVRR